MATGSLAQLFGRVLDALDYWLMRARLSLVDAMYGPEPPTEVDEMREADHERLRKVFSVVHSDPSTANTDGNRKQNCQLDAGSQVGTLNTAPTLSTLPWRTRFVYSSHQCLRLAPIV